MLTLRRCFYLALGATLLLTAWILPAQDTESDRAVATYRQAMAKYKAKDYVAAKDTFLKVDRAQLSDADKAGLDDYLSKIDLAIRHQAAAMNAYHTAVKALAANDPATAKEQFEIALASEDLPEPVRRDARAQLALVTRQVPSPLASTQPAAAAATQPAARQPTPSAAVPAAAPGAPVEAGKVLSGVLERRAKANALLAEGKQALAANDPTTAAVKFEQALALVPEMEEARALLQQTQTVQQPGPLTVLEQRRQVQRQRTDVEFDKALKRSSELLLTASSAGDFDAASESARLAENVIQAHRTLYTVEEYRDRLAEVAKRLDGIQARRSDWEKAQVQKQLDQMAKAEAERAQRAREQLVQKIDTLTENAKTLREEQKYKESLEVVQQILHLQPANSWAADQENVLRQFILLQDQKNLTDLRQTEETRSLTDIHEAAIPWYEHILFPRNWREKSQWLEGKGAPPLGWEEDRRIRQMLKEGVQSPVDIDVEKPLSEVLESLAKAMGVNIRAKWRYLEGLEIGYTREGTLVGSMRLEKVTYEKVLRVILEDASGANVGTPNELGFMVDGGEISISTKQDFSRPFSFTDTYHVRVYDTRDIIRGWAWSRRVFTAMGAIQPYSGAGISSGGGGGGGGAEAGGGAGGIGGGGAGGAFGGGGAGMGVTGEANVEPNQTLRELIVRTIDPPSWGDPNDPNDPNNPPGRVEIFNDQLVVRQTPANHAAIADLINEIRQAKEIQVAIEAKFISVSSGYLENIGVDLDFYFNLGSRLGSTTTTDTATGATVPGTGGTSGWGTGPPGTDKFTPMGLVQGSSAFTQTISSGPGSIGEGLTTPAATLQGRFLDDIQVDFLIRATQAHRETRTLTAPRLTLMSGTNAVIIVGRRLWYIASVTRGQPTVSQGVVVPGAISSFPSYLDLGTTLEIDAAVSADLKYVTLRVRPQVTTLLALTTFETSADPSTGTRIQVPDITLQSLDTTVTVPDGGTLLLGGLKSLGEVEREMGVPVLSKIPIINRAFTNRAKVRDDSTLLILIKPTIIVPRNEEKRLFP